MLLADNTETIDNMANEYVKPYRKIVQKGGDENALRGTIRPRPRIWSYNIADSKAKASTFQSHLSLLAYTSFSNAITKTLLAREASKHILGFPKLENTPGFNFLLSIALYAT